MLRFPHILLLAAAIPAFAADLCPLPHLSMVTFFEGRPEDQASLVYDELVQTKNGSRAIWHLHPDSGHEYSLVCTYDKPTKPVTQKLSQKFKTCVVEYGKSGQSSKLPPVISIQCRE